MSARLVASTGVTVEPVSYVDRPAHYVVRAPGGRLISPTYAGEQITTPAQLAELLGADVFASLRPAGAR